MIKKFFLPLFFLLSIYSPAQGVFCYVDELNHQLKIFENGLIKVAEIQRPKSFQSSVNFAAYVSDVNDFKIYRNGIATTMSKFAPINYTVTDHLLVWSNPNDIQAFYNNKHTKLCNNCNWYDAKDIIFCNPFRRKSI